MLLNFFNFILGIFNIVLRGFLIKTFWTWFILTTFVGLPAISIISGIGISLFIGGVYPWHQLSKKDIEDGIANKLANKTNDKVNADLFVQIVLTFSMVMSLGVGYIVHLFM